MFFSDEGDGGNGGAGGAVAVPTNARCACRSPAATTQANRLRQLARKFKDVFKAKDEFSAKKRAPTRVPKSAEKRFRQMLSATLNQCVVASHRCCRRVRTCTLTFATTSTIATAAASTRSRFCLSVVVRSRSAWRLQVRCRAAQGDPWHAVRQTRTRWQGYVRPRSSHDCAVFAPARLPHRTDLPWASPHTRWKRVCPRHTHVYGAPDVQASSPWRARG